MDKISIKAPAKINLYLRVLGKRPDGYHEIDSLMQAIDLYDQITIEKSDLIELECDDPSLPVDDSNLAFKAAALIQQRSYFPGARINLKKGIPVGAGLGGGSSDAAFVIRGLCSLYNLELSNQQKHEIACALGSDVPFFLSGGQALVGGRGEKVYPVKIPLDYGVIVLAPPVMSSTADIYRKLKIILTKPPRPSLLKRGIESSSFYRLIESFGNDLEEIILAELPELKSLKEILIESGCVYSSVTGSGSAVFGITRSPGSKIHDLEIDSGWDCRVFHCRPVLLPPI